VITDHVQWHSKGWGASAPDVGVGGASTHFIQTFKKTSFSAEI